MNSEPVSQAQQEHNYERITGDVTNDVMKLHLNILQLNFGVIRAIRTGTYEGTNWGYTQMVGLES